MTKTVSAALFFMFTVALAAVPPRPEPLRCVNDGAGLLLREDEQVLETKLATFRDRTETWIVVVTVEDLGGRALESYTIELAQDWGIGQKSEDWVLVLFARREGKVGIEVGPGLAGAIPDAYAQRLIDETIVPDFRKEEYFRGLDSATDRLMELPGGDSAQAAPELPAVEWVERLLPGLLLVGAILLVLLFYFLYKFLAYASFKYRLGSEDLLWRRLAGRFYPAEVEAKRKELLNALGRLGFFSSQVGALVRERSAIAREPEMFFTERNEIPLLRANAQVPFRQMMENNAYSAAARKALQTEIDAEIAYFTQRSGQVLNAADTGRRRRAIAKIAAALADPFAVFSIDPVALEAKLYEFMRGEAGRRQWEQFESVYTVESIRNTWQLFQQKYEEARAPGPERDRRLYNFHEQYVAVLLRQPNAFLKPIRPESVFDGLGESIDSILK